MHRGYLTMSVSADYTVQSITSSAVDCRLMVTGVRPAQLSEVRASWLACARFPVTDSRPRVGAR